MAASAGAGSSRCTARLCNASMATPVNSAEPVDRRSSAMGVSSGSGRGSLAADQVPLGFELVGEGGVAGEAEDLELAVGALACFHHAAPVPVEFARSYDPDDGCAVAQGLPLGLVLLVLVPYPASTRSTSAEPSWSAIASSNSIRKTRRGLIPSTSSATAAMKW